jgi:tRNA threonylcarbamoyladenosine biosynthesis protein TsaB
MITLAIDTSNKELSMAIFKDGSVLGTKEIVSQNKHSVYAVPYLEELLKNTDLKAKDINQVICSNGPGSYTGIRIGLTIAKTLAYSVKIPLYTVSSLQALSVGYERVMTLIDARRSKVYVGLYEFGKAIQEDSLMTYDEAFELSKNYSTIVSLEETDLTDKLGEQVKIKDMHAKKYIELMSVLSNEENVHSVVPNYIKPTQAEMDLKK